jgi:Adenosyl cobinamide kinase/adenosyl cobinamide phosphate guanylyltransferase
VLIFVTGGVRSGKSSWAEHYLTVKKNQANRLVYIATSFPSDEEMTKRILQHQLKRAQGKEKWLAIEQTNDVGKLSKKLQKNDFVLLDCLTTLLTNELFFHEQHGERWQAASFRQYVLEKIIRDLSELQKSCELFCIVSNEVNWEFPARSNAVFQYVRLLGHLHQQIVERADLAVRMEFGIPVAMKGELQ